MTDWLTLWKHIFGCVTTSGEVGIYLLDLLSSCACTPWVCHLLAQKTYDNVHDTQYNRAKVQKTTCSCKNSWYKHAYSKLKNNIWKITETFLFKITVIPISLIVYCKNPILMTTNLIWIIRKILVVIQRVFLYFLNLKTTHHK